MLLVVLVRLLVLLQRLLLLLVLAPSGRRLLLREPCACGQRSRNQGDQHLPADAACIDFSSADLWTMPSCIGGQIAAFDAVNTGQAERAPNSSPHFGQIATFKLCGTDMVREMLVHLSDQNRLGASREDHTHELFQQQESMASAWQHAWVNLL